MSSLSNQLQALDTGHRDAVLRVSLVTLCCCTAATNPFVDLASLKLPETPDFVGGHGLLGDPGVDGVFGDPKVGSYVVCGQPRLSHAGPPSLLGQTGQQSQAYRRVTA